MTKEDKIILNELDKVNSILMGLSKTYPDKFEHVFFATLYDDKSEYKQGIQNISVMSLSNLEIYIDFLLSKKNNIEERNRFENLLNIPSFRVICSDDYMDPEIVHYKECGMKFDWPQKGVIYNVEGVNDSIIDGQLCFVLRDGEGKILESPDPKEGYPSYMFIPDIYTQHN